MSGWGWSKSQQNTAQPWETILNWFNSWKGYISYFQIIKSLKYNFSRLTETKPQQSITPCFLSSHLHTSTTLAATVMENHSTEIWQSLVSFFSLPSLKYYISSSMFILPYIYLFKGKEQLYSNLPKFLILLIDENRMKIIIFNDIKC